MAYEIMEVDGVTPENGRFPVSVQPSPHDLSGSQHVGQLVDAQIPAFMMRDSEHQVDPHTMLIDGRDVSVDGAKLDTIEQGAEVNNLSDQQATSLTSGTHSSWHHHDDWYYRKADLSLPGQSTVNWLNLIGIPVEFNPTAHNHDDRYYTETEIDTILAGYSEITHNHNDIYYTETEVDTLLANYSLTTHTHDNRYFTETEITTNYYTRTDIDTLLAAIQTFGIKGAVDTFANLPATETDGAIYIVRQTVDTNYEGFYSWDGSVWNFLSRNVGESGITDHNNLINLNTGDYWHLTLAQYGELTSGQSTSIHIHDDLYYTEIEVDAFLANKSNVGHTHDDRYFTELEITANYYTKTQLNTGQLDSRYYTEIEVNNLLAAKSDISHDHNSLYYTQSYIDQLASTYSLVGHTHHDLYYQKVEVNNLLSGKSDVGHIHDDRYFTESELQSNSGVSGATLIGVSYIGGLTSNNVQDALLELLQITNEDSSSLDSAYDIGKTITADIGPVKIDSTTSTNAPIELTNRTTVPTTSLSGGQLVVVNNELYIFDLGRNKWLTPSKVVTLGKFGPVDGHLLHIAGGSSNDASGYKMPKDGTITTFSLHSVVPVTGKDVYIRLNGLIVYTAASDINGDIVDVDMNLDFNAGDILSVQVSSTGVRMRDVSAVIEFKWRV